MGGSCRGGRADANTNFVAEQPPTPNPKPDPNPDANADADQHGGNDWHQPPPADHYHNPNADANAYADQYFYADQHPGAQPRRRPGRRLRRGKPAARLVVGAG